MRRQAWITHGDTVSVAQQCVLATVSRATVYAHQKQKPVDETVLCSERFADCAPPTIYATLLDDGVYLGSVRTMYRLLAADGQARERRNQLTHPGSQAISRRICAPARKWREQLKSLINKLAPFSQ